MTTAAAPARRHAAALATGGVLVIMLVVLARAFGAPDAAALVLLAGAAVLVYAGYPAVPVRLRKTAFLLFGVTIALMPFARDPVVAIERGIFISGLLLAMISSVLLLAQCALRSPRVQRVGAALRGQPAKRRYLSFTTTSQMFSAMLGMAGSHIMLVMAAPSLQTQQAQPTQQAQQPQHTDTRDKIEAVIGVTRGFGAAGFWSPVFGNMVTLLALYPTLVWADIFPVGLALAQVTLLVGFMLNRKDRLGGSADHDSGTSVAELLRDGLPLLIPMLCFMGLLLTVSRSLGIVVSAAVVMLAPLTALLFYLATGNRGRRWAHARDNLRETAASYPRLASEALVFMAAGCAGSVMAAAFPATWAQGIGNVLDQWPFFAHAFLLLAIMGMALAGVHPVLSAVFLASTITPDLLNLPPVTHMAALLTGWGLSAVLTPFSVLSLTASRYAGTSLYDISFGRNWLFAAASAFVCCGVLTAAARWM